MRRTLLHILILCFSISCTKDSIISNEEIVDIEIPITNTLGVLKVKHDVAEGYTLFSSNNKTYLINKCGQRINEWTSNYNTGHAVYLLKDGSILRAGRIDNSNISIGGIGGIIERFNWEGDLIWSYTYSTNLYTHHHDMIALENGNIIILALEKKTKEEAIVAGRNPDFMLDAEVYTEQLIELTPIGTNSAHIVWKWDMWDHLVQNFDETKSNYGIIKDNPQLMDINSGSGKADWLHFNSIQYNEELDQIIMSSQTQSEFYIIDHSTNMAESSGHSGGRYGKGGDILYRWGNPQVYNAGTEHDKKLFGQHFPHWIPKGYPDENKIIVFNNGLERNENYSSVEIIELPYEIDGSYGLPQDQTNYGPSQPVWSYTNTNRLEFYSRILSGAHKLSNGNTLICEGTKGKIFEINDKEEIVWEYINPHTVNGVLYQGETPLANSLFRAIKYPLNYEGFKGRKIEIGEPIEVSFNIGNCK